MTNPSEIFYLGEGESPYLRIQEALLKLINDRNLAENKSIRSMATSPGINGWRELKINDSRYFVVLTDLFSQIFEKSLMQRALYLYPEQFNTNNADDVICALYQTMGRPYTNQREWMRQNEYFAVGSSSTHKVLVLTPFRIVSNLGDTDSSIFCDGFLHLLEHFRINQKTATSRQRDRLASEFSFDVVKHLIGTYFTGDPIDEEKRPSTKSSGEKYDNYERHYGFSVNDKRFDAYLFESTFFNIAFVSSIHRVQK